MNEGSLQNRRYFFWRFSGERGQARGEHEVRDTRDRRDAKKSRACLALRARLVLALASPKKRKKNSAQGSSKEFDDLVAISYHAYTYSITSPTLTIKKL